MILITGSIRVPVDHLPGLRPHMLDMIAASRAEPGCLEYVYAEDVAEPGLIRVFERWRDQPSLDAHFASPHLGHWRAVWPRFGVSDRLLFAYEVTAERAT